jgi:hypothetical protein
LDCPCKKSTLEPVPFAHFDTYDLSYFYFAQEQNLIRAFTRNAVSPFAQNGKKSDNTWLLARHVGTVDFNSLFYDKHSIVWYHDFRSGTTYFPHLFTSTYRCFTTNWIIEAFEPSEGVMNLKLCSTGACFTKQLRDQSLLAAFIDNEGTTYWISEGVDSYYQQRPSSDLLISRIDTLGRPGGDISKDISGPLGVIVDFDPELKTLLWTRQRYLEVNNSLQVNVYESITNSSRTVDVPIRWPIFISHWCKVSDSNTDAVFLTCGFDPNSGYVSFYTIPFNKASLTFGSPSRIYDAFYVSSDPQSAGFLNGHDISYEIVKMQPFKVNDTLFIIAWMEIKKGFDRGYRINHFSDANGRSLSRVILFKYSNGSLQVVDDKNVPLEPVSGGIFVEGGYGKLFNDKASVDVFIDFTNERVFFSDPIYTGYLVLCLDECGRFWGVTRDYNLELFGPRLPYRFEFKIEVDEHQPSSFPVDGRIKMDIFDYRGQRIEADVLLVITTPEVCEFADGGYKKLVTTSTEGVTEVPIKVKRGGLIVVDRIIKRLGG